VRYYLLREISPAEDGDFTYEKFEQRYNADLAGGVGNLVSRVVTMAAKLNATPETKNAKLKKEIEKTKKDCAKALEEFKFNEALKIIWELISWCDKYINQEKPWEQKAGSAKVVSDLLFALENIAELLKPFLPETSKKVEKAVKEIKVEPLFPRI